MGRIFPIGVGLAATLIAVASPAFSQGFQPDLPSDGELLAAYCFGVAQHQLSTFKGNSPALADAGDRLGRARVYLASRGYLNVRSPIAKNGIDLKINQGKQDARICQTQTAACLKRCGIGEAAETCNTSCQDQSGACVAEQRCYGQLPY